MKLFGSLVDGFRSTGGYGRIARHFAGDRWDYHPIAAVQHTSCVDEREPCVLPRSLLSPLYYNIGVIRRCLCYFPLASHSDWIYRDVSREARESRARRLSRMGRKASRVLQQSKERSGKQTGEDSTCRQRRKHETSGHRRPIPQRTAFSTRGLCMSH